MTEQISQLKLVWRTRLGSGGRTQGQYGSRTEQKYLDFTIDGQSLGELLQVGDMIGCLGWGKPEYEGEAAQVLLLNAPSSLETGRAMLYICPECGDIGCGAITVQVEMTEEYFVWRGFGYENDYDLSMLELSQYQEFGPYFFNKAVYRDTLSRRSSEFAAQQCAAPDAT